MELNEQIAVLTKMLETVMEERVNIQIKYTILHEELVKDLKERVDELKGAMKAYEDRNRWMDAMQAKLEENKILRAQLSAYCGYR